MALLGLEAAVDVVLGRDTEKRKREGGKEGGRRRDTERVCVARQGEREEIRVVRE